MSTGRVDHIDSKLRLAIFISRTLWSWPTCLEEVVPFVRSGRI
jgi:Putative peptidase family